MAARKNVLHYCMCDLIDCGCPGLWLWTGCGCHPLWWLQPSAPVFTTAWGSMAAPLWATRPQVTGSRLTVKEPHLHLNTGRPSHNNVRVWWCHLYAGFRFSDILSPCSFIKCNKSRLEAEKGRTLESIIEVEQELVSWRNSGRKVCCPPPCPKDFLLNADKHSGSLIGFIK